MKISDGRIINQILNYCRKALRAFGREGLPGVWFRLKRLLYVWEGYGFWHLPKVKKIVETGSFKYKIFLTAPTGNWNIDLFQRPQQLALAFANLGYLFFYCPHDPLWDNILGIKKIRTNLYLTNCYPQIIRTIDKFVYLVSNASHPAISPKYIEKLRKKKDFILIYDYLDEYCEFGQYQDKNFVEKMLIRHRYLVKYADIVVCTADKLYYEVKRLRQNKVYLVPNGSDYNHFRQSKRSLSGPSAFKKITNQGPIIGYFGALAEWFDYDLMNSLVVKNPDLNFVIIGSYFDDNLKALNKTSNLHYIGVIPYKILPQYASRFDVAIIPFKINKITEATSPIKLFEYMALGKPIVSTNIRECRKYKSVLVSRNQDEFSNNLRKALKLKNDKNYLKILDQEAKKNTWEDRASQLDKIISRKTKELINEIKIDSKID